MTPSWKDKPDAPGLWLCAEINDSFNVYKVRSDNLIAGWADGSRYYGPLPPDTKDE